MHGLWNRALRPLLTSIALGGLLVACTQPPVPDPTGGSVIAVTVDTASIAPHGATNVSATRDGRELDATWRASAGIVTERDGRPVYVAPGTPGTYTVTADHDGASADALVTVVSPTVSTRDSLPPTGGEVRLESGATATFEADSLLSTATIDLSTFDTPPTEYGPTVTQIGPATGLSMPLPSFDLDGTGFTMTVPSPGAVAESTSTLAEVRIALADGTSRVVLESYSPLSSETSRIHIDARLLRSLHDDVGLLDPLSIVVQPVDIGAGTSESLRTQDIEYLTGLFEVDLGRADFADASRVCGSGDEEMPPWIVPAPSEPDRQPIVLITGWQVLGNFFTSAADESLDLLSSVGLHANPIQMLVKLFDGAPIRNPAYCDWAPLLQHLADIGLDGRADVYVFGYDSSLHIGDNARRFREALASSMGDYEPIIVAHSMGGMVTDAAHAQGLRSGDILTLGTPYTGSLALTCTLGSPFGQRCLVGRAHPVLRDLTSLPPGLGPTGTVEGLRGLFTFALTANQGTRDLTWENPTAREGLFAIPNPFLASIHEDDTRSHADFTAFYGDFGADPTGATGGLDIVHKLLYEHWRVDMISDGIVPRISATMDRGDGAGPSVGSARSFGGHDHIDLKGGSDRSTPPSCGSEQADAEREKACEAMRAIGDYLMERLPEAIPPTEPWMRQFGSPDGDYAYSVATRADGSIVAAGFTYGALGGTSSGGADAFVRELTRDGEERWTVQFGTAGDDRAYDVAVSGDGSIYLAGVTTGSLSGASRGGSDAFLRKLDEDGGELWTVQFGTPANDEAAAVAVDHAGNVIVAGYTSGALGATHDGQLDAFVTQFSPDGGENWTTQFGTSGDDVAVDVAVDLSEPGYSEILVVGSTTGNLGATNAGGSDAFLAKLASNGTIAWTRHVGTPAGDYAYGVAVDGFGAAYVVGNTAGSLQGTNAGALDVFLGKFAPDGAPDWIDQFGTAGTDDGAAVAISESGDIVAVGSTEGSIGTTGFGGFDAFARTYDASGAVGSSHQIGSPSGDYGYGVAVDGRSILLAGITFGDLEGDGNSGGLDAFVTRIDP